MAPVVNRGALAARRVTPHEPSRRFRTPRLILERVIMPRRTDGVFEGPQRTVDHRAEWADETRVTRALTCCIVGGMQRGPGTPR